MIVRRTPDLIIFDRQNITEIKEYPYNCEDNEITNKITQYQLEQNYINELSLSEGDYNPRKILEINNI